MTYRTRRIIQQIILFAIVLAMLLAHNSLVSLNVRLIIVGVAVAAGVALVSRRLRDNSLLISPLDYGWLPFVLLTGLTVLTAQSPRRSLEDWLWVIGIQLPLAYGALYIFRRRWPERGLYRAVLGAGAYFYVLAAGVSVTYFSGWLADRAAGIAPPGFRIFGVMNHPNIFAMFIAISAPLMFGYVFTKMKRIERAVVILSLVMAAFSLFGTGSRTGLVACIVGIAAALAMALYSHPSQPLVRFRTWAADNRRQAAMLVAAGGVVILAGGAVAFYLQFGRPFQDNGNGRLTFFRSALTMVMDHPLVGTGPGGFVENEVLVHSVPPYHILPHAHDMILNTAAESGLIGLLGFMALLLAAVWICVRVWRTQSALRPMLAGPIGGLIAFALFGILDSPINQFGPFFLATIMLSYVAAGLPAPEPGSHKLRMGLIVAGVWGVILLSILVLIPYSVQWNLTRPDRPASDGSNPVNDAHQLDAVLAYDGSDPLVTFQSAFSWADATPLTDKPDSQTLKTAIARFERGLQLAPNLAVHYLDLAVLYRQAGRAADAVHAAQRATELANEDPVNWLNLGVLLDAAPNGSAQTAHDAFVHALQLEPRWATVGFWQETPTRQQALADYLATPDGTHNYYSLVAAGNVALSSGKKDEALAVYQGALKIAPGTAASDYAEGLIKLANGDSGGARRLFTAVTNQDIVYPEDQRAFVDAYLNLGDLAKDGGDNDTMLKDYTIAYTNEAWRGLDGYGTRGSAGYALVGYQRYGRISDYVRGVVIPDITPDQIPRFRLLAQSVSASGDSADAADIYDHILEANPDDVETKVAMASLVASGNKSPAIQR